MKTQSLAFHVKKSSLSPLTSLMSLIFILLLTFSFLHAGTESEYNSNKYNANAITENSITSGTIQKGNDDFFKFTPNSDMTITIETSNYTKKMSMLLMEGCGWNSTDLISITSPTNTENVIITYAITANLEYCIDLSTADSSDRPYTLTLSSQTINHDPTANDKNFSILKNTSLSNNLITQGGTADSDSDGDTLSASKLTDPSHGSANVNNDGSFTYTPNADYFGVDSFTYELSDGNGGTDSATVSITITSNNPIANDKSFTTQSNTTLNSNVLSSGGTADSDPNGDPISVSGNTNPSNGTLSSGVNADGNFTYIPTTNYIGTDSFEYTISDGVLTATATVNIEIYAIGDEPIPNDDANATEAICGSFEDVLQTRSDPSDIHHKSGASADIYDNPDCTLNTGDVDFGSWQHLHCNGGDATASGTYGQSLNINYSNLPDSASINDTPSSSTLDETVTSSSTLTNSEYNKVDIGSGSTGSLNVDFSSLQKINTLNLTTNNSINFTTPEPYNLEIGSVGIVNNGSGNSFTTTTTPKNIKIDTFELPGHTTIDFEASQTIKMEKLKVGRASTDVKLKAQYVQINTLNQSNSGGGTSNIEIVADYVDIGTLDLDQEATITFKPYTPGKRILFRANSISASSSSTMIVSSGNYYTPSFSIPGSSNVSSIHALDSAQLINMFIDGDFTPGNNPGINSDGNNGNFGSLPPANFLFFVNGDLETGGGGTTFNATVYVEGSVDFGSPSYLKGALSSHGDIEIGNNSEFYYDQSIDDAGWGECTNTTPTYDNQYTCGLFPSVLISYTHITSNGNNDQGCYTANISYPEGELTGDITCNPSGCGGGSSCQRQDPPINRYRPTFPTNSKSGSANGSNPTELTDLEYGNLTYGNNSTIHFNPSQTYSDNTTKVMLLGETTASKSTLQFEPGDYYFDSLTIDSNNNNVKLPNGGPVRIFIKNDLSVNMNNLHFNTNGNQNDLFVYVGGDYKSLGNGGGTTSWRAYMYVKGNTTLNNNSNNWKIYGGITTEGVVTINGNNPDFIQEGDKGDGLGYGECQMCYDGIKKGGFQMDFGQCPGMSISFMSTITIPIKTSENLTNASVDEAHKKSWASGSFLSSNEVVDQDGNHIRDAQKTNSGWSDGAMGMNMSLFNDSAVTYVLGDDSGNYGPTSDTNYQQLQGFTFMSMDFCSWKESLAYVAHYDDGDKHYDVQLGQCEEVVNPPIPYITGPFDAWDTFRDNASTPPTDRNISTKIVNKVFHLSLASLNKTNDAYETKQGTGDINVSIYPNGSLTPISNGIIFDANTTAHVNSVDFNVIRADKNARVGFKLCATYEHNATTGKTDYFLYSSGSCSAETILHDCNATTSGTPTWHICYSTDNFAIRPYAFRVFGKNQYKLAGEDFNITVKGVDENNNGISSGTVTNITSVSDYNASLSDLNITSKFYQPSPVDIARMQANTGMADVTTCPNAGVFTINNSSDSFTNGEVNASLKFSETGILDINISEKQGHEWALVDENDTNITQRYIKSATVILDNTDISKHNLLLFAPYKFDTTAEYNTTNAKKWLYIHDINGSNSTFTTPVMAAFIKYTITAKNKDGNITYNYTKTCFPDTTESTTYNPATDCPQVNGLKMNTTFDLFLDADINSTADANISLYTEDNNSNAIYTPLKNKSILTGNTSTQEQIFPVSFESGVGEAKVYFNIDRNASIALNPIKIVVIDVNTSTSWMANPGSPKEFNGSDINQSKNFYYGRVHAPDQRFADVNGTAKVYYEVYCDGCNKTNFNIDGNESIDSINWFTNTLHVNSDGNVTPYSSVGLVRFHNNSSDTFNSTSFVNGIENIDLTAPGTPYKDKIDMNSSSWLKFDPTDFMVEFYGTTKWAGQGIQGKTVDLNISKRQNKRLDW